MYLMSKNTKLARIDFSKMIFEIYNPGLMPFALRGNNVNLFTVRDWISDRVLNISRSNAKKIISALGLNQNNRIEICFACKGLCLTDCYWFKSEEDTVSTWENVNLYTNSLSKAIAKVALTGEYVSIQGKIRTPEVTGQGAYAKCWRRVNNEIYLYKAGSKQGSGIEHKIDILCSDILDLLGIKHVKYTLAKIDDREVSKCKNMTNESLSICAMEYFMGFCNRNNIDINKWLASQELYYQMMIVDYLIMNTDRHSGNWGIYFDSNNGNPLWLHPLYDHNNAFDDKGDYMSKVISGKTLEECARYSKQRCNIRTDKLEKWLKSIKTKARFKKLFNGMREYKEMMIRLNKFKSW